MDILQQYIAFSRELDRQFAEKGRTIEALKEAIEVCKRRNILREYLETREKEVIRIMTILFDQGYANKIALKESEAIGAYNKAVSTARKALDCNIPRDVIATITGLTVDEVAAL